MAKASENSIYPQNSSFAGRFRRPQKRWFNKKLGKSIKPTGTSARRAFREQLRSLPRSIRRRDFAGTKVSK